MKDRVVLLTGATSGIGRAAAIALARMGATVAGVCRDAARGEAVLHDMRAAGGGDHRVFVADLSSQAAVRRLAGEVRSSFGGVNVLVNNAGAIHMTRRVTEDGIEETLAVNHLAPFLLTNLLLDLLRANGPARVIAVASEAHRVSRIDFDDLQSERRYRGVGAYALSKLANILFTRELARRAAGTGVTANALHPGGVNSGIWRGATGGMRPAVALMSPFLLSPEKGAAPLVRLATSPDLDGVTGKYFARDKEARPSAAALDDAAAARLWEISERLAPLDGGAPGR